MPLPQIHSFAAKRLADDHFQRSDSECDICKSAEAAAIDNPRSLPATSIIKIQKCGHIFHELCLSTWLDMQVRDARRGTCPSCRRVLIQSSSLADNSVLNEEGRYVRGYWWCCQDEFEESSEDTREEERAQLERGIMQIRERRRTLLRRIAAIFSQAQSTTDAASRAEAQEDLAITA